MKRGKNNFKFSNRVLYSLITFGILTLFAVGVYAYGTSSPSDFGHSGGEINYNDGNGNPSIELKATGKTPYIDFSNDVTTDYDARFILSDDNTLIEDGARFGVRPDGQEEYAQTHLQKWGLSGDGTIYIEPAQGQALYLTDSWGRTGVLNIQFGSVVSSSGIYAPSFVYSSDRTLKENILPLTNSLDKIKQLQGVSFNWKESGDESIGLIAQDVEKIFPELVSTDSEGLKSVEYGNLVAVLIEAVKEQQKQIDELKEKCN